MDATTAIERTDAPDDGEAIELDVRNLGPPEPLTQTLETLETLDGDVLVQFNDRAPEFLFPKLDDRGFAYDTVENDEMTVTTIWEA
jgi:hypothetical protein